MKINDRYYDLTPAERRIADFVIAETIQVPHYSISELSEKCNVANATITRFCAKLGCHSYAEFRLSLARAANSHAITSGPLSSEVTAEDTIEEMCMKLYQGETDAIAQTLELIKPELISRAVELLKNANVVLCMGQGGSMIMAEEAAHLFATTFPNFFAVNDDHMQLIRAAGLTNKDVILYFSYSAATKELMDLISITKKNSTKVILITRFPKAPGALLADLVLQCGSNESPLQLGSCQARVAQLFLLDVLHTQMCRQDMKTVESNKQNVLDALTCKQVK